MSAERGGTSERGAPLARGRASYDERAWSDAFEALQRADRESSLEVDDLERLAWAAGLCGRDDEMLAALERVYHAHERAARCGRAARAAFWIGFRLFSLGEPGRATGWLARAERAASAAGDCAERGYLLLPTIARHFSAGDHEAAQEVARRAVEIGEQCGDADLVAFARQLQGRALLRQGDAAAGLPLLDEAMVAATAGELSPLVTGLVYCSVIATCQQVGAVDRAREWTTALADWCGRQPQLVTFTGACLVHRAEVMQLGGDWPAALQEAERARERVSPAIDPEVFADACYQRAEIHRLRGDIEAAEEAYRAASEVGREPQPGLALLRLAQGRADAAASAITRVLDTTTEQWKRARFLPACVEIHLAAGDLERARQACDELERTADRFGLDTLGAMAAHARGQVRLAEGDAQGAVEPLRRAFGVWQRIGAPYIAARIRLLLGRAYRELGDSDGAQLEIDAAERQLEQLGAAPELARSRPSGQGGDRHGLSERELEVLVLVATGKTNKAIAGELCLSERTIDRHVSNIFKKLGVASRTEATAFAYEHGLVQ